jgi:hypothetical protein
MWSRRHFLLRCTTSSAALALAAGARAEDNPEPTKPHPLLTPGARGAIDAGLKFLKDNQLADGSFGTNAYKGSVGVTSLGGVALLSGGNQPGAGAFGPAIDSALDFVLAHEDLRRPGFLNNPAASPHGPMYNHGFAVLFLATAHGHVPDRKRAEKVRDVLGRAVGLTLASQNAQKGWRYLPSSTDSDLTVTAGQVCALRAARDAGIGVPRAALDGAAGYVKRCQDRDGGFHYMLGGAGKTSWVRTGAGLLALYSAGVTRGLEVERALKYLLENRPDPKAPRVGRPDLHYYFGHLYAALATWAAGGDVRKDWYTAARDDLVARQAADGKWADALCPHYATAMALIALQAPGGRLSPEF